MATSRASRAVGGRNGRSTSTEFLSEGDETLEELRTQLGDIGAAPEERTALPLAVPHKVAHPKAAEGTRQPRARAKEGRTTSKAAQKEGAASFVPPRPKGMQEAAKGSEPCAVHPVATPKPVGAVPAPKIAMRTTSPNGTGNTKSSIEGIKAKMANETVIEKMYHGGKVKVQVKSRKGENQGVSAAPAERIAPRKSSSSTSKKAAHAATTVPFVPPRPKKV